MIERDFRKGVEPSFVVCKLYLSEKRAKREKVQVKAFSVAKQVKINADGTVSGG